MTNTATAQNDGNATGLAGNFSSEAFDAFTESRNDPPWLVDARKAAWSEFARMAWPTRRDEEWMRTDIRMFHLERYSMPVALPAGEHPLPPQLLADGVDLGGQSISMDSTPVKTQLQQSWADKGVVFCSLNEAAAKHPAIVQQYLAPKNGPQLVDRFAALHAAVWSGGHFLYVPRGVVIDQPLHAMSAMSAGGVDFGNVLVVLEDGAEATLLTEMANSPGDEGGLHCGAIQLCVADNAKLRFVDLQNWNHRVWHFAHQAATVGKNASLQWTIAAIGSRLAKVNQHVSLAGTDSESQVNGVLFTEGKQHLSYHTLQRHQQPHTRSDFLYKAALQDQSRTVWRGLIKVDPGAQKTDGFQRNDNLIMSADARADSIPGLEIEADDVRCTHGSTTGRVDEELIFYAQARGFTRQEATRMIVTGFFQQIFDRITIESVREALGSAIAQRVREYV